MKRPTFALILVVALTALAGCSATPGADPNTAPRSDTSGASLSASQTEEAGGVTLTAMWEDPGRFLRFHVKLDNHMIDLDGVTLAGAILRNDRGDKLTADPWTAPPGGHHRDGWLSFEGDTATFLSGVKWVELSLPPIGSVTLPALRWSPQAT